MSDEITLLREEISNLKAEIEHLRELLNRTRIERDELKQIVDNLDRAFDPGRGTP